jgi:hypothetical protein
MAKLADTMVAGRAKSEIELFDSSEQQDLDPIIEVIVQQTAFQIYQWCVVRL